MVVSWSDVGLLSQLSHSKGAFDAPKLAFLVGNGSVYGVCANAFDLVNLSPALKQITR